VSLKSISFPRAHLWLRFLDRLLTYSVLHERYGYSCVVQESLLLLWVVLTTAGMEGRPPLLSGVALPVAILPSSGLSPPPPLPQWSENKALKPKGFIKHFQAHYLSHPGNFL
jgi:hypothetical protein